MTSIAWLQTDAGGSWGAPETLGLPADARGLLLAEGVFETVLVLDGRPRLLAAHLQRWVEGAALLGLPAPPPAAVVEPVLHEAIARSGITSGALRLNWCRGSGPRGLEPLNSSGGLCWLQLSTATPLFTPASVIVSPTEVRSATSLLSRCKSFGYGSALVARRQARQAGADDALLASSDGTLCCGSSANLLVQVGNHWHTPPVASGCLPGIMRARALELGLAREASVEPADLASAQGAVLLNSLSCRPIRTRDQAAWPGPAAQQASYRAEQLWLRLLEP